MIDRRSRAGVSLVAGTIAALFSLVSAHGFSMPRAGQSISGQPISGQPVPGQTYSYGCQDISHEIVRSNGGAQMQDFLPAAGTACLARGATLTIRNADPHAWLYLYGTLVQYPDGIRRGHNKANDDMTFVEGGVLFGGGCATCLSVAFLKPGERATYTYDDTTQTWPNGTVGNCQGCAPDMKVHGQTWRLRGAARRGGEFRPKSFAASGAQPDESWTPHQQAKCCTCVHFTLWNADWDGCNGGAPYALNIAHDNERGDVLRVELHSGDHWWDDSDHGVWSVERSLVEGTKMSNGNAYWEAYSFLWECGATPGSDGKSSGSYWLVIEDIHSDPKIPHGVVPIQSELLPGGYFAINARTQNGNAQNYIYIAPTPLACGVWHDVVRQFDIDPSGGFLREWLDGTKIVDFTGKLGNPADTPYLSFQIYRANYFGAANSYAQRIADVQFGTASLAGRIGSPPHRFRQRE